MRFSNQNTGGLRRPIDQETAEVPQYVPLRRKQPQNLRIRVVTAVIFIFVMAAFLIPALWVPWIALFLFAVIAVIGGSEFSAAMRMAGFPHKPWIVSLCSLIAIILPLLKIGFGKKEYLVWSTGFPGLPLFCPICWFG